MSPARYLVTGATGFIGRRLTRRLVEAGHPVTALVRATSDTGELERRGVRLVTGDLTTGAGLAEAARDADRVLHLAALVAGTPAELRRANTEGTRHLVRALADTDSPPRLVLCSSLAAAGPEAPGGGRAAPVSHYGRTKRAAEEVVRDHLAKVPAAIVRPPIVYGPGDPHLVPSLLPMVRLGLAVGVRAGRRYSLLHVDDLCTALVAVAEDGGLLSATDPRAGVYEPCDGAEHSWPGLLAALAATVGRPAPRFLAVPDPVVTTTARLSELVGRLRGRTPILNRDKAREMRHGWVCSPTPDLTALRLPPPTPLRDGLAATLAAGQER